MQRTSDDVLLVRLASRSIYPPDVSISELQRNSSVNLDLGSFFVPPTRDYRSDTIYSSSTRRIGPILRLANCRVVQTSKRLARR